MNQLLKTWAKAVAVVGLLGGVATETACSSSSSDATPAPAVDEATAAKADFWQAFGGGDIPGAMTAHQRMIATFDAHPNDDELARLIGFAYVLGISAAPTQGPPDPAVLENSIKFSKLAVDLAQDSHEKMYDNGFYGGLAFTAASFQGDAAAMQDARNTLEAVTQAIPAFGFLARGDVMVESPKAGPDFPLALESYFRFYEQCAGVKLDRAHPDMTPVLKRPFADSDTACGNSAKVPHGIQGGLLNLADALVKNGQDAAAKSVYQVIKQSDGFATWAFADVVDQRLASDLAKRAAQYETGDSRSQPPIGAGCLGCHQR